jgi:hypothetical protein
MKGPRADSNPALFHVFCDQARQKSAVHQPNEGGRERAPVWFDKAVLVI